MQMTPSDLNITEIEACLSKVQEIKAIHHIHVWNLTDKILHFECRLSLQSDVYVSETAKIAQKVEKLLHDEFDIDHVTIQFEYGTNVENNCDCK